jgi:hypothetical protein
MRLERPWRIFPLREFRVALLGARCAPRIAEPRVEAVGFRIGIETEFPQTVIAHTAAGNQHTFAAERGQGSAYLDVRRWISPAFNETWTMGTSAFG